MMMALFAIYMMLLALMCVYQRKLMYFPHTDLLAPAQYGLEGVDAGKLKTSDGELLDYWYVPAKADKPTILFFHGNGGHLGFRTGYVQAAKTKGYGLLMLSYRGYGTSTGTPTEQGLYLDANAAYDYVRDELDIPDERLVILGESLGSGVAVELARGKKIRALVLQAPFTSTVNIAAKHYWWLPVRILMKDRFESINKVGDIHVPVLVLGAQNDTVTTLIEAKKLYDAFAHPKKMVVFEGIGHNDFDPMKVLDTLDGFDHPQAVSTVD